MKRVFNGVLLLLTITAAVFIPAMPVTADQNEELGPQSKIIPALIIKAPAMAKVDQEVTITVFSKHRGKSVEGASVYALNTGELAVTDSKTSYSTLLSGYAETALSKGILIGSTGSDGIVAGKLPGTGRFMLVAIKTGYLPGFSRITVTLASLTALDIRIPSALSAKKEITFSVTERYSSKRVEGAAVYALPVGENVTIMPLIINPSIDNKAAKSKPGINAGPQFIRKLLEWAGDNTTVIKPLPLHDTITANYASEIQAGGFLLGTSDINGRITYTFKEEGKYILVAVKDQCIPGFARIRVHSPAGNSKEANDKKRLVVKTPSSASAGQQVTVRAIFKGDGLPAENAVIYAFRFKGTAMPGIKPSPRASENGTATQVLIDSASYEEVNEHEVSKLLVQSAIQPLELGITDANGEVQYTFNEAGQYILTAMKDGCIPGGARINIASAQLPTKIISVSAETSAEKDRPVIIKTWEKSTSQPVSGAAVYVLKINDLTAARPMPPVALNLKSQGDQHRSPTANVTISSRLKFNGWVQNEAITAKEKGTLAGYTDDNGQLSYNLTSPGQYLFTAYKDGYLPGFTFLTYAPPTPLTTGNSQ